MKTKKGTSGGKAGGWSLAWAVGLGVAGTAWGQVPWVRIAKTGTRSLKFPVQLTGVWGLRRPTPPATLCSGT